MKENTLYYLVSWDDDRERIKINIGDGKRKKAADILMRNTASCLQFINDKDERLEAIFEHQIPKELLSAEDYKMVMDHVDQAQAEAMKDIEEYLKK